MHAVVAQATTCAPDGAATSSHVALGTNTPCTDARCTPCRLEGDGTKVYASCLAFYDELPAELRARHEQLCGARALKAICLLSHQPYLDSSERVSAASWPREPRVQEVACAQGMLERRC